MAQRAGIFDVLMASVENDATSEEDSDKENNSDYVPPDVESSSEDTEESSLRCIR